MMFLKFVQSSVKSVWNLWIDMFLDGTTRIVESFLSSILILWGLYMMSPARYRVSDIYRAVYANYLPDLIAGCVMLGVGMMFMFSVLTQREEWRSRCCLLAVSVFSGLWGVYLVAGRASVGLVILPFYAFSCALLYLRPYLLLYFRNLRRTTEADANGELDRNHRGRSGHRRDFLGDDGNLKDLAGTP